MSEDNDFFGGFANIANELSGRAEGEPAPLEDSGAVTDTSKGIMTIDPEDIFKDDDINTGDKPTEIPIESEANSQPGVEEGAQVTGDEPNESGDEPQIEEPVEPVVEEPVVEPEEPVVEEPESTDDLSEVESDISQYFTEKLGEALGVDIKEDDKFDNADDVVDFMRQLVDENSKPVFASNDIEKLNAYVEDGGDLNEYFKKAYGNLDTDSIDLSSEGNQKTVIKEFLQSEGYSETRIDKRMQRYEEAGTLEEEAEDAKELLTEYKQKNAETLLADQEKLATGRREEQQKLVDNVQSNVKALKNVRGIPVSESERKQLQDYIFAPDAEGLTKYQKDYTKDVNNLIESAYFTMKGDALIQKIQNKATSNAVKNIKTKLESKGKRTKNVASPGEGVSDLDVLTQASKFLSKR